MSSQTLSRAPYIWVFPISKDRWLWKSLAAETSKRTGMRPLFIVASEQDADFYRTEGGWTLEEDQIAVIPDYLGTAIERSGDTGQEMILQASALESEFGISMMRDLVQADRHLGRGFVWSWNSTPNSHTAEKSNVKGALAACVESFQFYKTLFKTHRPGLIIAYSGGSGIASKPVALLCHKHDVPFRSFASARISGAYYWAVDEFENSPGLENAFSTEPMPDAAAMAKAIEDITPTKNFSTALKSAKKEGSLLVAVKASMYQFAMRTYHRLKGYRKASVGYTIPSMTLFPFRIWYAHHRMKRPPFQKISDIPSDRKVVAFPLQTEPEISLQGQSPEFSSVLTAIQETALNLPSDAILAVKEHPLQMGRRPEWFYQLVAKLPNSILIQPSESGTEFLERASMVVQINSSVGYEAAMRGLPVVTFCRHGAVLAVPHVHLADCHESAGIIRECLHNADMDLNIANGARFVNAVRRYCMKLEKFRATDKRDAVDVDELEQMVSHLLKTLPERHQNQTVSEFADAVGA